MKAKSLFLLFTCVFVIAHAQRGIKWTKDGNGYYQSDSAGVVRIDLPSMNRTILVPREQLIPSGKEKPLTVRNLLVSDDGKKMLIYTNSQRVWRQETRGDYWLMNTASKSLKKLGATRPESSLMFATFSPDGERVAYVSERNIFVENIATGEIKQLTQTDNSRKLINGTFDWAYEEEFDCRDGFRWSPDGKHIAYWQIDANTIRDFYLLNNTDSIYSFTVPVEYPKAGETPSSCRIGVVDIASAKTTWMNVPGDPRNNYITRMEWAGNANELIIQQLNRKQNTSRLMHCNAANGATTTFYTETDSAWIDTKSNWNGGDPGGWDWLNNGKEFLWASEKDGWRHLYRVSRDGKSEQLITKDDYDVINLLSWDEAANVLYFIASPQNATQRYLYRVRLDGKKSAERVSPDDQVGTHSYDISPNCKFALHTFSNYYTPNAREWITLPNHTPIKAEDDISKKISVEAKNKSNVEFFTVKTDDGVEMDGWMAKPTNFDPKKKYPVLFLVYSEPAGANALDRYGMQRLSHYNGSLADDGYIYMTVDNRGTPAPKGRAWRKAIYRKIGIVNIRDQAMAAKKIFEWSFVDTSRIAVWGHSGGGTATLNLLFQYPELYKTGIAMSAVVSQLTYDNIYQERFMGLPQENKEDFVNGSPLALAKNLRGNLLYIHGTGDDNVHYQNAEMLINELVKYNRQFQIMPYPNRTHGLSEGEGTRQHLATLFTNYLKQHCPPGRR